MKAQHVITIIAIIGSIMAFTGMSGQEAYADTDSMVSKMIEVNNRLPDLKNSEKELDELTLGKTSFEIKQIKKALLEINDANDRNEEKVDKIYLYLKENYMVVFEKYENDVKEYQKENGLSATEKKLVSQVIKSKLSFENNEAKQDVSKETEKRIEDAKVTQLKEDYQKMVNKIGVKLADEANGGVVQNIHYKVAMDEIINSKNWKLAVPAIDRMIPQINNEEFKGKLENVKNNIKQMLDKKEKQEKQEKGCTRKEK